MVASLDQCLYAANITKSTTVSAIRHVVCMCSAVVIFLFLAGLWSTGANTNSPNFHPKLTLAAPTIGYMLRLMLTDPAWLCSRLNRPDRTESCRVLWQLQSWYHLAHKSSCGWNCCCSVCSPLIDLKVAKHSAIVLWSRLLFWQLLWNFSGC